MDPELAALAQSAGATVVALMATDAWQAARRRVLDLWRRVQPGRADAAAVRFDAARDDAVAAVAAGDQEAAAELRAEWQGLFRRLLAAHPEAAREPSLLLDELRPAQGPPTPVVVQRATASGHARVYQAGRDQHITER